MNPAETTTLWARALADELGRGGIRDVVLAPGSRSAPLVLALASDGGFRLRVHLDERSVGFFALGLGRVTGRPAAVVTTSGTAAANLLPAVVEASQSEVPVVLLTADRPRRLRDADANQAIDQVGLYGRYTRSFHDLPQPSAEGPALRHLRALVARAVLASRETPRGPVHLNVPLDKPLEPVARSAEGAAFAADHPLAASGRGGGIPFVQVAARARRPAEEDVALLSGLVRGAERGVIVAGPSSSAETGGAAKRLAAATGLPLLADPLSGARFRGGPGALVVDHYDLFLGDERVRDVLTPDLVLRIGASPTSAALQGYLEHHSGVRHVVVDDGGRWKDHGSIATDYVRADPTETLHLVCQHVGGTAGREWAEAWHAASEAARAGLAGEGDPHEGTVLAQVAATVPRGATLFVSSSMPIRDLDAFGRHRNETVHVHGNRGASGIDGIVSTAFGVAAASEGPCVCVLGDLALFHDQNGLLWSREEDSAVVFVLVDNDGGGIFHGLPVREHEPYFTPYFATPHGLDFHHAAELHGIPLRDIDVASTAEALQEALSGGGTRILRVRTERAENASRRGTVADAVASRVRAALT
jgi:2-succinyl-5-enolpyruvyl-6-hydroxy-3-cyclohexene-1-carboxylate synthase